MARPSQVAAVGNKSSWPVFVTRELAALFAFWTGGRPRSKTRARGAGSRSLWECAVLQDAGGIVSSNAVRTVEDGQPAVGIAMRAHRRLDEMRAPRAGRNSQHEPLKAHRIVAPDHARRLSEFPCRGVYAESGGDASNYLKARTGCDGHCRIWSEPLVVN
jgi:hypothetical protein